MELSVKADQARQEAEQIVAAARKEAADILNQADTDGKLAADEFTKKQLASIQAEVENLKRQGEKEAELVKRSGEQRLPKAIEIIVKTVTPE